MKFNIILLALAAALDVCAAARCWAALIYQFSTVVAFKPDGSVGLSPQGSLYIDNTGNLYGATASSLPGDGTVFEVAAGTHAFSTLATFNGTNGNDPIGGPILFDGNLYGTTNGGGTGGDGAVYQIAAGTHAVTTLASFNGSNGEFPFGSLVADANGNLFGTAFRGGASNDGVVFEVAAGTHALSTLLTFNGTDGKYPKSNLLVDANGNLYGTTLEGGPNNRGTVFKLAADTHALTEIYLFNGIDGDGPWDGLISDAAGNLYGTTETGGVDTKGTVFELNPTTHLLTILASFDGTNGSFPVSGVTFGPNGDLYGTTTGGGANGYGTVYELNTASQVLTMLHSFNFTDGEQPYGNLVFDANGDIFGTTSGGGLGNGSGTVFELAVPEPSTLLLALVAVCGLLFYYPSWALTRIVKRTKRAASNHL